MVSNSLKNPFGEFDLLKPSLNFDGAGLGGSAIGGGGGLATAGELATGGGDFVGAEDGPTAAVGGLALGQVAAVLFSTARFKTSFIPWHLKEDPAVQMLILVI